jgi:hypothetical protein
LASTVDISGLRKQKVRLRNAILAFLLSWRKPRMLQSAKTPRPASPAALPVGVIQHELCNNSDAAGIKLVVAAAAAVATIFAVSIWRAVAC